MHLGFLRILETRLRAEINCNIIISVITHVSLLEARPGLPRTIGTQLWTVTVTMAGRVALQVSLGKNCVEIYISAINDCLIHCHNLSFNFVEIRI